MDALDRDGKWMGACVIRYICMMRFNYSTLPSFKMSFQDLRRAC